MVFYFVIVYRMWKQRFENLFGMIHLYHLVCHTPLLQTQHSVNTIYQRQVFSNQRRELERFYMINLVYLQGTIIFSSLYGSHIDTDTWKEPDLFQPERFLDEDGRFSPKLDKSLPFGSGKRLCAGETFSRNVLFLMLSALVQNFTFKCPDKEVMPLPREICTGMLQYAPEFRLTFVPR